MINALLEYLRKRFIGWLKKKITPATSGNGKPDIEIEFKTLLRLRVGHCKSKKGEEHGQ